MVCAHMPLYLQQRHTPEPTNPNKNGTPWNPSNKPYSDFMCVPSTQAMSRHSTTWLHGGNSRSAHGMACHASQISVAGCVWAGAKARFTCSMLRRCGGACWCTPP